MVIPPRRESVEEMKGKWGVPLRSRMKSSYGLCDGKSRLHTSTLTCTITCIFTWCSYWRPSWPVSWRSMLTCIVTRDLFILPPNPNFRLGILSVLLTKPVIWQLYQLPSSSPHFAVTLCSIDYKYDLFTSHEKKISRFLTLLRHTCNLTSILDLLRMQYDHLN